MLPSWSQASTFCPRGWRQATFRGVQRLRAPCSFHLPNSWALALSQPWRSCHRSPWDRLHGHGAGRLQGSRAGCCCPERRG